MSEMKCPKRRSQRKITVFINRDKQQTKNNFFIHLHVNRELLLSHSGYIYRTGRGGCDNQTTMPFFQTDIRHFSTVTVPAQKSFRFFGESFF